MSNKINVTQQPDDHLKTLSLALMIERELRRKRDKIELAHFLVNETSRLHNFDLALFFKPSLKDWKLVAASGVPATDDHSLIADWIRGVLKNHNEQGLHALETSELSPPEDLRKSLPSHVLWMPLKHPDAGESGCLILFRNTPFGERERLIAEPLSEAYGHALIALQDRPWYRKFNTKKTKKVLPILIGLLLVVLAWPVSQTALAPAEIVAKSPQPITVPFSAIVSKVNVKPYSQVKKGDVLAVLDASELRMQRDVARKALAISMAELERFRHESFMDIESKAKVAIWERKVDLQRQELDNAIEKLSRHLLIAERDGIVLYDHRYNWSGRPVKAGQRLMTLADPKNLEVRIDLPVEALIPLEKESQVKLFMDIDPSTPLEAKLSEIGYQARPTAKGILAFQYRADLLSISEASVLGGHGTARLEGQTIPLIYSILHRPLAALRQAIGL